MNSLPLEEQDTDKAAKESTIGGSGYRYMWSIIGGAGYRIQVKLKSLP